MKRSDHPNQLLFPVFCAPVVIPQGDGSVIIRPGRPVAWLTPGQFAIAVGLSRDSVYRYVGTEALPDHLVEYPGLRRIRISAAAVSHFLEHCKSVRLGSAHVTAK
ncbi:MAG: hypothetical protein ACYDH9_08020 [Limisphaerales bacterium]